jgi:hypothetical protein
MLINIAARILFVIGLALLATGTWLWFANPSDPVLQIANTDLDIGESPAGTETILRVPVENHSAHPVRVLGLVGC